MEVDGKLVKKIAKLARIKLEDSEVQSLEGELAGILTWVEQLEEVDTDKVAPLTSVVTTSMKKREDVINDGDYPDQIVRNAPEEEDNFFVVPKVVE